MIFKLLRKGSSKGFITFYSPITTLMSAKLNYNVFYSMSKVTCSHNSLIPGLNRKKYFCCCCQMKTFIFLIIIPKFQLQIYYTLEVLIICRPIPILILLCIYITASSSVSHTCFCPGENKKQSVGETSKHVS